MDFIGVCLVLHQWHHVVLFSCPNTCDTWRYITLDIRTKEHNFCPFCSYVKKNTWRYFSHADYAENAEVMRNILTSRIELRRLCAHFACAHHPDGKAQAKRVRLCVFLYISPILILQNLCVNLRRLREKNLCVLCVFA